jgi:hypothetical protein
VTGERRTASGEASGGACEACGGKTVEGVWLGDGGTPVKRRHPTGTSSLFHATRLTAIATRHAARRSPLGR